ncbi:MAG: flagellar motor protein MotB [Phycisphaerales bacterium JB060]
MAKKRKKPPPQGVPEWVVTYGDLMSLLLCFFILLAAFSELKQERDYQDVVRSIQEAFGYQGGIGKIRVEDIPYTTTESLDSDNSETSEKPFISAETTTDSIAGRNESTNVINEGLRFTVGASLTFEAGSYELSPRVERQLREEVAPALRGHRVMIEIRGHAWGAEDRISGLDFYDLSYRRAKAVMNYLVKEVGLDPKLMELEAKADAEPMAAARGPGAAAASNRRVQVIRTEIDPDETHPDPNWTGRP